MQFVRDPPGLRQRRIGRGAFDELAAFLGGELSRDRRPHTRDVLRGGIVRRVVRHGVKRLLQASIRIGRGVHGCIPLFIRHSRRFARPR